MRQALNLLVDRASVQEQIYGRTGIATANFLNAPSRFVSKSTKWEFNVDKANQILEAAGWKKGADGIRAKDGKKLKFLYQTSINAPRQKTQAIVKQAAAKAGIELELKSVTASVFFSSDVANPDTYPHFYTDIQMFTTTMTQPDPELFMTQFRSWEVASKDNKWQGRNITRWRNEEYDKLFRASESELDPVKRAAHVHQDERDGHPERGGHPRRVPPAGGRGQQRAARGAERLGLRLLESAELVQGGVGRLRGAAERTACGKYLLRRLLILIPVLAGISLVLFTILAMAPGDPFEELATNPNVPAEVRMNLRAKFGLDDPIAVRYVRWFTSMLRGDWGFSFASRVNVDTLILQRLPTSLFVLGTAQLLGILIALPIGTLSAVRPYSIFDQIATTLAFIGFSLPTFFTGHPVHPVLLDLPRLAAVHLPGRHQRHRLALVVGARCARRSCRWPCSASPRAPPSPASCARPCSTSIRLDYINTARAKGLAEHVTIIKHGVRNALIPVVTLVALQIPTIFTGAVITEQIFRVPGIGSLLISAILANDTPVIMAITFVFSCLVVTLQPGRRPALRLARPPDHLPLTMARALPSETPGPRGRQPRPCAGPPRCGWRRCIASASTGWP